MANEAASTVSFDPNHARVLVVGPMGVGKTSLVRALCQGQHPHNAGGNDLQPPRPTIGCNVDVKHLAEGQTDRFIEFWDIGGHPDAAPARRMFFEDSSISGVLFVHDLSNPRSLRELRVWVDELEAAGIIVVDKAGGCPTARASADDTSNGWSRGSLRHVPRRDRDALAEFGNDLEGGECSECVPTLVVGNKADAVEAEIGDRRWAKLPTALEGKPHVCVSARSLDEGPFLRFIDDIFRYHAGGEVSSEEAAWSPLSNITTIAKYAGIEGDTLASSFVANTNFNSASGPLSARFHIPDVDRLADRRSHQTSTSPAQSHGVGSMEASSIGGHFERREHVAPSGGMGETASAVGRTWWMECDPVSTVRRSRKKQS